MMTTKTLSPATETRFYLKTGVRPLDGWKFGIRYSRTIAWRGIGKGQGGETAPVRYVSRAKSDNGRAYYVGLFTPEQAEMALEAIGWFCDEQPELYVDVVRMEAAPEAPEVSDLPAGWTWDNEEHTSATRGDLTIAGYTTEIVLAGVAHRG